MICPRCGQPGEPHRYCARCGTYLAPPTQLETPPDQRVSLDKPVAPPAWSGPPPTQQFPTQQYPAPQVGGPPPGYGGGATPAGRPGGRGARTALIVVAVVALLAVAGGVVAWITLGGSAGSGPVAGTTAAVAPPSTAGVPASSTAGGVRGTSKSQIGGSTPTVSTAGTPTAATTTTVTVATGLSDVPAQAITCNTGFFVQLASELDQTTFTRRVDTARAAGQLPAGSHWAETSASCGVVTAQQNVLVLYAGPFAGPADGCAARLAGPFDAFIKSTVPGDTEFLSCVCPADPSVLPALSDASPPDQWIGELQRLLGARLDYDVGTINADPATGFAGAWGSYTPSTADAVRRFQADQGLPTTGQVDPATWAALRTAGC